MLDTQHANRPLTPDNRHPGKRVELFFAGFGPEREVRVGGGFGEVQRFNITADRTYKSFAQRHSGNVNRLLRQTLGGVELKHALAQQVDRADLAIEAFSNNVDNVVELRLRAITRCHHLMQAGQNGAGSGSRIDHGRKLTQIQAFDHAWVRIQL